MHTEFFRNLLVWYKHQVLPTATEKNAHYTVALLRCDFGMSAQRPEFSCSAPIMNAARERSKQAATATSAVSYNSSLGGR